jgi:hypothetical protein
MRYLPVFLLIAMTAAAQSPCTSKRTESGDITIDCSGVKSTAPTQSPETAVQLVAQPATDLAAYTILLVPQHGKGYMVAIDKEQKLAFVPITSIKKAVEEEEALPVRYGDLVQLVRQLTDDNQRLKTENEHLWKVAENHSSATPVIVQQQAPPPPGPNATRRQMELMLLRSLLTQEGPSPLFRSSARVLRHPHL